ncbi:MAG TPA: Mur ligase family protein [Opitutaceae bacterium]|nr:Mur ligase family protein [Opitutaceae bacterium]
MPPATTTLDPDTVAYLRGLKQGGVVLGLDRMRGFVAALGQPQDRVPVIHIAGTNGKGSVAAMLESILRRAGWRTGLYTSPHLVRLGERIQVNRQPIDSAALAAYVREFRPVVADLVARGGAAARPSYFEFMTGLALVHFARSACDIAIIEVGMGGRLDATNVVTSEVSVITSIGLDHMDFLGSTLAAIAREKAGVIKPGRPVVIGALQREAEAVVRETAAAASAPVVSVAGTFGSDPTGYPTTNLAGAYQQANAATATLAARQLAPRWRLDARTIEAGLADVSWPGRWQEIEVGERRVIIDSSHNEEGAAALDAALAGLVEKTGSRPVVVVGVLGAVRARPLLATIGRHASEIRLVRPQQARACSFEDLEALVPAGFGGAVVRSSLDALFPGPGVCLPDVAARIPVVVTGSIYLAGEALARIDPSLGPVEHELQDF